MLPSSAPSFSTCRAFFRISELSITGSPHGSMVYALIALYAYALTGSPHTSPIYALIALPGSLTLWFSPAPGIFKICSYGIMQAYWKSDFVVNHLIVKVLCTIARQIAFCRPFIRLLSGDFCHPLQWFTTADRRGCLRLFFCCGYIISQVLHDVKMTFLYSLHKHREKMNIWWILVYNRAKKWIKHIKNN